MKRYGHGLSVAVLTMVLLAASSSVSAQANSGDDSERVNCALIRDGIQRLACYDAQNDPEAARESADDQALQQADEEAAALVADDVSREERVSEALGDDPDAGVMAALVDNYLTAEKAIFSFTGSFVTHRPNYILPITYVDDPNPRPVSLRLGTGGYDYGLEQEEAKYQISFKIPLLTGIFDDRTTFWFGYTQQSYWQVYNTKDSAPFRETNYEPEIFFRHRLNWDIGPGTLSAVSLGFNHQSNGQSEPRSRSWNRITGAAAYSYDRWLFMVHPWYRLPESSSDDDNSDIEKYLGYGSYHAVYKLTEDRTFSLKLLNNMRSTNRTSVEFGYSFPMGDTLKGFFQYYNGYGESLIDYNERIERFGVGIMLNNWL
ncbi:MULTISPECIES: phospholipase A [Marinobacter]|uniref:phospholipase A n=1 Tax=Marinobacter TaxID=2742 RepID=UPI0029C12FD7|nr:phospholipase A [Marinobacter sp.]MDX5337200.1 phospholipase A [Marinobacter sp.]MDX5388476.1 phospholipase A [Marinobacter sp.]MDX5473687.1 phospholipase A [Marinobacter sp.]